jgi:hypothetical protein
MQAVEQWAHIQAELDPDWTEVRLAFTPEESAAGAAAVLGALQPVRVGDELRFHVTRRDAGAERTRNTLRQLDRKRIWGTLTLLDSAAEAPSAAPVKVQPTLVAAWDEAIAELPPDWSDVLCELELDSSDHIPRAALLGAPLNPSRVPGELALRFRASGKQGYGVSPQMARRCFERMDAEGITGRITVMLGLSDAENVGTQGPVWRLAGKSI